MRKWFGQYYTTKDTVERQPGPFLPKLSDRYEPQISRIERMFFTLNGLELPYEQTVQLARDSRARNAYGTASIEGNPMTLEEVQSLMERVPSPDRDLDASEREILLWITFMENLGEKQAKSSQEILEMHEQLLEGIVESAGEFKTNVNFVADGKKSIHYLAAGPEHTIPDLENLLDWYRHSPLHPILRIGLFFHEFQSIHPFGDGNGRVGRALATMQLQEAGFDLQLVPLDYAFNAHQWDYHDALQETRIRNDFGIWIEFWVDMLEVALHMGQQRATLNRELPRLPAEAVRIAEWVGRLQLGNPGRKFAFADAAAAFPHISERTLRRHLTLLAEEQILTRSGAGRGSRYQLHDSFRPSRME